MAQAVWTGDLSFGLVNIPVKLFTATSPKRVRFHQYEAGTGRRIRYRRIAEGPPPLDQHPSSDEDDAVDIETWGPRVRAVPEDSREVADLNETADREGHEETSGDSNEADEIQWEEIVKGYEIEPGRVVTIDADELESVAPERSRALEVEQFVDIESIDPILFEKSYYVVPQRGAATERPYWLLHRAMEATGKVAIGRFVMRTKEYLVAVRAAEHVLVLGTLFYADEVRDPKEAWVPSIEEPSERELQLARQFIDALAGEWEPTRHRDAHRERLLDLLHSKSGEAVIPQAEAPEAVTPATDLMEILQASVDAATRARDEEGRETG
ncbi:MAG: Ku protein [Actinomycetota bacterium]